MKTEYHIYTTLTTIRTQHCAVWS